MPSRSLGTWNTVRVSALDEIEDAHRSVGGTGRGRRYATQQINYAYAVLLSSQFQGYCRDLHSECILHLVRGITPLPMQSVVQEGFVFRLALDRGNPNPGNIAADFNRLGLDFWDVVNAHDPRNRQRQRLLEDLNQWRNAIAHQDFTSPLLGGLTVLTLERVRRWRSACMGLARSLDRVMADHIYSMVGTRPW